MNFKPATDRLFRRVTHSDLASALGVSVALIRQARLNEAAAAARSAPQAWKEAVARLAEAEAIELQGLASALRADIDT